MSKWHTCKKNEGTRIIRGDIQKFWNNLMEDTRGSQQKLNFVEFPKAKWTYLIYADGTYFWCLGHQQNQKYLAGRFKKLLQPMPEWNYKLFIQFVSRFGETMLQLLPLGSTIQHSLTSKFGSLMIYCCWSACLSKCWSSTATRLLCQWMIWESVPSFIWGRDDYKSRIFAFTTSKWLWIHVSSQCMC